MDYIELNLLEMLDTYGEDKLQSILSRFMCPQNIDVENFIQTKAIGFARQRLAMTYFNPALSASIPGQELLSIACSKVREAQFIIGGKAVYIECASNPKLYNFYSASQFVQFGQRERDTDEIAESPILVQMLKYFRD